MRWYAKLSNGDVAAMTIDELDAAYENGGVDANTLVLAPDAAGWVQLGELAGLRELETAAAPASRDFDALIPLPPPRRARPRWVAPTAFAVVAAATFIAAGFEAHQAGAFSRRTAPAEDPARPPPPSLAALAATGAPSATATVSVPAPQAQRETEKRPKRNLPRSAAATVAPSEQGGIFTSGGNAHDPLNTDLP